MEWWIERRQEGYGEGRGWKEGIIAIGNPLSGLAILRS